MRRFNFSKEGEYKISLEKTTETPKINLEKEQDNPCAAYVKEVTGHDINQKVFLPVDEKPAPYFGLDLSEFVSDPFLRENLLKWKAIDSHNFLDKFDEKEQEQIALMFTNEANYASRLNSVDCDKLIDNMIRLSYPAYSPHFDTNISRDFTLYVSGLVNMLLKQNNRVFGMRTKVNSILNPKDGMYYMSNAELIKLSELKKCTNNDIYIFVPFIQMSPSDNELSFCGIIQDKEV